MCRVNLRSSCLTAYRRWLDRAGTFTNMTLSVLGGPCWIRTLLLIFVSRSLICAWWNSDRTPAAPELRSSVPIDASLYTRALLIRLTWGVRDFIFARSEGLRSYGPAKRLLGIAD